MVFIFKEPTAMGETVTGTKGKGDQKFQDMAIECSGVRKEGVLLGSWELMEEGAGRPGPLQVATGLNRKRQRGWEWQGAGGGWQEV